MGEPYFPPRLLNLCTISTAELITNSWHWCWGRLKLRRLPLVPISHKLQYMDGGWDHNVGNKPNWLYSRIVTHWKPGSIPCVCVCVFHAGRQGNLSDISPPPLIALSVLPCSQRDNEDLVRATYSREHEIMMSLLDAIWIFFQTFQSGLL